MIYFLSPSTVGRGGLLHGMVAQAHVGNPHITQAVPLDNHLTAVAAKEVQDGSI